MGSSRRPGRYRELRSYLLTQGFFNSKADTSLFTFHRASDTIYLLVYVDDMVITSNNNKLIDQFIATISSRFSLKDLGELSYFLGTEATRISKGLHLMQKKYVIDLLTRTNMMDARPVSMPMAPTPKLSLTSGTPMDNPSEYRAVLGSLQYLALTRPDIAFPVNLLSQLYAATDGLPLASCQANPTVPRRDLCSWHSSSS